LLAVSVRLGSARLFGAGSSMFKPSKPRAAQSRRHPGRLTRFEACVSAAALIGSSCNGERKELECRALVDTMNGLSSMLAATRGVLSAPEVQPAQVAGALKPFSEKAKTTARALEERTPTESRLRAISARAGAAAGALSQQAAQMAEYAQEMGQMDSTNRTVDDSKRRVDELETLIRQTCERQPGKCTQLSRVLARFPAPTDQSELGHEMAAWTHQLTQWTDELSKVSIEDPQLRSLVETFKQRWDELGAGLSRLVVILEVGKKYEDLNREFNAQIVQANQAIAEVNATCQK